MSEDAQPSIAELRDRSERLRQALRDMPPHSGSGTRAALEDELTRLQRRVADRR